MLHKVSSVFKHTECTARINVINLFIQHSKTLKIVPGQCVCNDIGCTEYPAQYRVVAQCSVAVGRTGKAKISQLAFYIGRIEINSVIGDALRQNCRNIWRDWPPSCA